MGAAAMTKAEHLARIASEETAWAALLAEAGEDRLNQPGAAGDWTPRDVIAHLNAWRALTLERLEAARRGDTPRLPWPEGMSEEIVDGVDGVDGVDEINDWMMERDQDVPGADTLAESRDQFKRLRAAVEALPEADLAEPGRFAWLGGLPLSAVLDGHSEHLQEHEAMIRAWIDS